MRFEDVYGRYQAGRLSCEEAGDLLGVSVSTFGRWRRRYDEEGATGLYDRRLGRLSGRRAGVDEVAFVVEQFTTRYWDFTAKHFHEHLRKDHAFTRSYTWLKTTLQGAGLIKRAARRSAHRKKRVRRPLPGMMLFQDGSTHCWIPALAREIDLIVTLDDATSEIYSAFFVEQEGTFSSFCGLAAVIERHGLFSSLYTDRGGHYFFTAKAGEKVALGHRTQVGRALAQLGIEHIASYTPQGRGRMERVFGTLQGRLPQELRVAGIATIEAANRYLAETYVPAHNKQFAVAAAEPGSAFVAFAGSLAELFCVQSERVVGHDNCVRYQNLSLQIPEQAHRRHFVKATVRVHEYADGSLSIFHGPRRLARYGADGSLIAREDTTRSAA